jgi:hypothetical protein
VAVVRQRRRKTGQPRVAGRLTGGNVCATPCRTQPGIGRQPRVLAQVGGPHHRLCPAMAAQQRRTHGGGRRRAVVAAFQVFQGDRAGRGGARHAGNPAREQARHQE